LFVGKKLTTLQSGLAPFHGLDEAIFFLKVTRYNILHRFIEITALLGGSLREPGFQVRSKMNFHALKVLENLK